MTELARRSLGRTGLDVTVMGFGAGGFSRAGLRDGLDHAASVVTEALHSGINLLDTAEAYRTEPAVALGIERSDLSRTDVVIATKVAYRNEDRIRTPSELEAAVEERLELLGTDYIDVLQVHGVAPDQYEEVRDTLLPVLETERSRGRVHWIGVTEIFNLDRAHEMLPRAIADGCWDVLMVGFNLLNQTARERVLAPAEAADVGTMIMFAVRQTLLDLEATAAHLREQAAEGRLPTGVDVEADLATIAELASTAAPTLADLAYRFTREEPGVSTVLVGTGNPAHLAENLETFRRPPLSEDTLDRLRRILPGVDTMTAQTTAPSRNPRVPPEPQGRE